MSTFIVASVFFGGVMIASAEEPDETDINAILSSVDISEAYSFEENDQISFQDYIDHEVDMAQYEEISAYNSTTFADSKLSGNEKIIYDKYKTATEQIANGDRDNSYCAISLAELGLDKKYSLSELGVSGLSSDEDADAAVKALQAKSGLNDINIRLVGIAVRSDCPYERYWMGLKCGFEGVGVSGDYSGGELYLFFTGEMKFYIDVNNDYMGSNGICSVNTAKTKAVKETISSINGILAEAKTKSDRDKINYYKDRICELTDYNYAALENNYPYGDPWQLVYVFDGNPSTQVVCEGYSKAFNYLCEKTQFSDPSIFCYTVTGYMGDVGEQGEGHMWNIMHWNDNTNYLVDITNVDGLGDELFMALPASGDINNGYVFNAMGYNISYKYDKDCRAVFNDSDLKLEKGTANNNNNSNNNNNNNNSNNNNNGETPNTEDLVREFVNRFYKVLLERDADEEGLNDWTSQLISKKKAGAQVAEGIVNSEEFKMHGYSDEEFVKKLYLAFFDREADESGYKGWINDLKNGKTRIQVVAGFTGSDEFKNLCAKYGINPGELKVSQNNNNNNNNQSNMLKVDASNADRKQVRGFVERLYLKILGREGEEKGIEDWTNTIMNSMDTGGTAYDAGTVISKGFFTSEEYGLKQANNEQFLKDCYAAFFNREPDEGGFNDWLRKLNNGEVTRKEVIEKGFGTSEEFKLLLESYGFKVLN